MSGTREPPAATPPLPSATAPGRRRLSAAAAAADTRPSLRQRTAASAGALSLDGSPAVDFPSAVASTKGPEGDDDTTASASGRSSASPLGLVDARYSSAHPSHAITSSAPATAGESSRPSVMLSRQQLPALDSSRASAYSSATAIPSSPPRQQPPASLPSSLQSSLQAAGTPSARAAVLAERRGLHAAAQLTQRLYTVASHNENPHFTVRLGTGSGTRPQRPDSGSLFAASLGAPGGRALFSAPAGMAGGGILSDRPSSSQRPTTVNSVDRSYQASPTTRGSSAGSAFGYQIAQAAEPFSHFSRLPSREGAPVVILRAKKPPVLPLTSADASGHSKAAPHAGRLARQLDATDLDQVLRPSRHGSARNGEELAHLVTVDRVDDECDESPEPPEQLTTARLLSPQAVIPPIGVRGETPRRTDGVSPGVTRFNELGHGDFTTLSQWLREYKLFHRLLNIKFFAQYRLWACFSSWRRTVLRTKIKNSKRILSKRLFLNHPILRETLVYIHTKCVELLSHYRFVRSDTSKSFTLDEFLTEQESWVNNMREMLKVWEVNLREAAEKAGVQCLHQKGFKVVLMDPEGDDEGASKIDLVDTSEVKLTFTEQAARRNECRMLQRFVKLVDYMIVNTLHMLTVESVKELLGLIFNGCDDSDVIVDPNGGVIFPESDSHISDELRSLLAADYSDLQDIVSSGAGDGKEELFSGSSYQRGYQVGGVIVGAETTSRLAPTFKLELLLNLKSDTKELYFFPAPGQFVAAIDKLLKMYIKAVQSVDLLSNSIPYFNPSNLAGGAYSSIRGLEETEVCEGPVAASIIMDGGYFREVCGRIRGTLLGMFSNAARWIRTWEEVRQMWIDNAAFNTFIAIELAAGSFAATLARYSQEPPAGEGGVARLLLSLAASEEAAIAEAAIAQGLPPPVQQKKDILEIGLTIKELEDGSVSSPLVDFFEESLAKQMKESLDMASDTKDDNIARFSAELDQSLVELMNEVSEVRNRAQDPMILNSGAQSELPFDSLNPEDVNAQIMSYLKIVYTLEKGLPPNDIVPKLKSMVDEYRKIIFDFKEEISNISGQAGSEAALEEMLAKVARIWNDSELIVAPYRDYKDVFILGAVEDIQTQLEDSQIEKCLEDYLESKRLLFPRFYFLSNEELLEILSQTKNPQAVQPHLGKCFDAIKSLEFSSADTKSIDIIAMISPEGERVAFVKSLKARGNVEAWLSSVEEAMVVVLRKLVKAAIAEYEDAKRSDWLKEHVGQVIVTIQRAIIGALITIDVHNRDIVSGLIASKVTGLADFEWTKQMRYYWDIDSDTCNLNLGGSPVGPAGTGKTETVKDLAKALAKQCVVFNCSDGMDYKMMGKMFAGLAQSGAWCCFDEFNRIDIEVLSVIAQQLLTIKNAKDMKAIKFNFEGREIRLIETCAAFITMNPGYAGRTELPDNLKALFRPIAMMIPEGFENAKELAGKVVNLYKLCSEQLSKQDHYDFGMRAVKSVLVMSGSLKRASPELAEELVLIRALRDSNLPKFLEEDVSLFQEM
ncbi:hypothetical protein HK405_000011 [Cladochytrium tenue]|nr:hypothetical protein HK405_000011 [Cladochytrium tenue]